MISKKVSRDASPCRECKVATQKTSETIENLNTRIRQQEVRLREMSEKFRLVGIPKTVYQEGDKVAILWGGLKPNAHNLFTIGGKTLCASEHLKKFERFTPTYHCKKLEKLSSLIDLRVATVDNALRIEEQMKVRFPMPAGLYPAVFGSRSQILHRSHLNLDCFPCDVALETALAIMKGCYSGVVYVLSVQQNCRRHPHIPSDFANPMPISSSKKGSPVLYFLAYKSVNPGQPEYIFHQIDGVQKGLLWYSGPNAVRDVPSISKHPLYNSYKLADLAQSYDLVEKATRTLQQTSARFLHGGIR